MQCPPREERIKQKPPHRWQKQNQLLWQSRHTDIRSTAHKNHAKQRNIHPIRQIHDHRNFKFLSQYSHEKLLISQTQAIRHPRQSHTIVQPTRDGNNRRQRIRGNTKRHVRPTPIRTHRKKTTRKTIRKTQIYPKQDSYRTLETEMNTHPIHPSR